MTPIGRKWSVWVAAVVLAAQPGFGQQRGGSSSPGRTDAGGGAGGAGAPSAPGTASTPGVAPRIPTNNIPTTPTPPPTQTPPPIYVSGRVVLEDGTAPEQSVPIERVCGGRPHTEAYTDSKGYFSFALGTPNPGVLLDASEEPSRGMYGMGGPQPGMSSSQGLQGLSGMASDTRFIGCELRARLPGYLSQSVSLMNHRALDNPDVGVILLHRIGESEGSTVSARTLAAPKDARKAYEKGLEALKKKKSDEALANFQRAVTVDQNFAAAWLELGKLQAAKNQLDDAHRSFDAAAKADPKFVPPYIELSLLEYRAQNWQALAEVSAQAAKLDAFEYPQSYLLNALANYYLKNYDAAEKSAREAERLDTHHLYPKSSQIIGVILANRQDYSGAAEAFRRYLKYAPNGPDAATVEAQLERVLQATATQPQ
jgi:tetratricopeptide (TPR) repeat protein